MLPPIVLARVLFVILATACGYWLVENQADRFGAALLAAIMALIVVLFEYSLRTVSVKRMMMAAFGLLGGLVISALVYESIPAAVVEDPRVARIICNFLFGYLGLVIGLKHADYINFADMRFIKSPAGDGLGQVIDSSVIIDGRIRDMIAGDVLHGQIIVPSFIINELQTLADSADSLKRGKGRRGLTILENLQNEFPSLQIVNRDYDDIAETDLKLVQLAKDMTARVVTNDYNLQKVAALYKVPVLNINELADMLRPSVFVGETFHLTIMREGKEPNQGVGYLADGTMVIVDDGASHIGGEIEIVVTSVLQTNTGRMVFSRPLHNETRRRTAAASK